MSCEWLTKYKEIEFDSGQNDYVWRNLYQTQWQKITERESTGTNCETKETANRLGYDSIMLM